MKIFLVRHAKSSWNNINLDDHERPLSKRGISDAILMRKYLIGLNVNFEKILCSSSVRTKQTLDLLIDNIDQYNGIQYLDELYHASADQLKKIINNLSDDKNYMIISHNPGITNFINFIDASIGNIATCSLCILSTSKTDYVLESVTKAKDLKK
tara:strand:+ start:91 stop:552 length:462 start_codon:yes stop_codon:yes gene_type:complete